ncbi:Rv0361 family membrane protein [Micromonospora sp. KLBMP9576]|uniref:Rv0361 family membrane protein n=1 Tax=Micromonospora sp. KLBMP9576 TaxID=3424769 RepID=UPI003D93D4B3
MAAGLLILTVCGVGLYAVGRVTGVLGPSAATDETRIRKLVEDFAVAVDSDDQPGILNLLCAEEAEELMADDDFDPSQAPPAEVPSPRPVTVADIRVDGGTASATVTRPSQPDVTLHFRKENGAWKVCAPAGDPPGPSASASPTG